MDPEGTGFITRDAVLRHLRTFVPSLTDREIKVMMDNHSKLSEQQVCASIERVCA